jgi:hypothetical protein
LAIKVIVPNKGLNGKHLGLNFVNGVAIVEDEAKGREIADSFCYEIEEEKDEKTSEAKKTSRKVTKKDKDEDK